MTKLGDAIGRLERVEKDRKGSSDLDDTSRLPPPPPLKGNVLGIDLGTTNSSAAIFSKATGRAEPVVIEDDLVRYRLPSVVWYDEERDQMVVGMKARRAAAIHPTNVRAEFKRDMPNPDAVNYTFGSGDRERMENPKTLSALVLGEIKRRAEAAFPEDAPMERVVVTVPAAFPEPASAATMEAARIAGFEDVRLLDEPTAAALAYALNQGDEISKIVVFDFGGGTLDCSVLTLPGEGDKPFAVRNPVGDPQLGGKDFDEALMRLLADRVIAASRRPLEEGPFDVLSDGDIGISRNKRAKWHHELKAHAEVIKIQLSSSDEAECVISSEDLVDYDGRPLEVVSTVTRREFEEATAHLVHRAMDVLRRSLTEAELNPGDVDRLVLVGGTTMIPAVEAAIKGEFGLSPYGDIDRLTAVAQGAAIYAYIEHASSERDKDGEASLIDVLASHHFGVRVGLSEFDPLIRKNDSLPTEVVSRSYEPSRKDSESVIVALYQVDDAVASRAKPGQLAEIVDDDFRATPPRVFEVGTVRVNQLRGDNRQIDVSFTMDRSRVLSVVVRRASDGAEFPLTIERPR